MLSFLGRITICLIVASIMGLVVMNYAYRMVDVAADNASDVMESD